MDLSLHRIIWIFLFFFLLSCSPYWNKPKLHKSYSVTEFMILCSYHILFCPTNKVHLCFTVQKHAFSNLQTNLVNISNHKLIMECSHCGWTSKRKRNRDKIHKTLASFWNDACMTFAIQKGTLYSIFIFI